MTFSITSRPFLDSSLSNVLNDTILQNVLQVVVDKLIEPISILVQHKHMNDGDTINEVKQFIKFVRQTIQHTEMLLETGHCPLTICNGFFWNIGCHQMIAVLQNCPRVSASPHPTSSKSCSVWMLYLLITSNRIGLLLSPAQLTPYSCATLYLSS